MPEQPEQPKAKINEPTPAQVAVTTPLAPARRRSPIVPLQSAVKQRLVQVHKPSKNGRGIVI